MGRNDHLLVLIIAVIIGVTAWPIFMGSDYIAINASKLQNLFCKIASPGQPTIICNNPNDTMTFVGTGGINITTNPLTKTVTWNDTGNTVNFTFSNVGAGAGVWKDKSGINVHYRSLIGTSPITLVQNANDITFSLAQIPWSLVNKTGSHLNDIGSPTGNYDFNAKSLTNVADLNATRVFQGGKQVIDTINAGTGILVSGSGSSRTITNAFKNDTNTAQGLNLFSNGGQGTGIYASNLNATELRFKSLTCTNLTCSSNGTNINISDVLGGTTGGINIGSPSQAVTFAGKSGANLQFKGINGTGGITLTNGSSLLTIGTANIPWANLNKTGSILNQIGSPTSSYSFANQKITNLANATNKNDAVNARMLGLLGNLTSGNKCADLQIIKYHNSNQTWWCANDIGGSTTINSFTGTINIVPQTGNTTITNSSGTIKVGLGVNPVIVGGANQTITKPLVTNKLILGGLMNASSNTIQFKRTNLFDNTCCGEGTNVLQLTNKASNASVAMAIFPNGTTGNGLTTAAMYIFATDYAANRSSYDVFSMESIRKADSSIVYRLWANTDGQNGTLHPIEIGMVGKKRAVFNTNGTLNFQGMLLYNQRLGNNLDFNSSSGVAIKSLTGGVSGSTIDFINDIVKFPGIRGTSASGLTIRGNPSSSDVTARTITFQLLDTGTASFFDVLHLTPNGANPKVSLYGLLDLRSHNIDNVNILTFNNTGLGANPKFSSNSSDQKITTTGSLVTSGYLGVAAENSLFLDANSGAGNKITYNRATGIMWKSGNVNGILLNGTAKSIDLETNIVKNGKFIDNVNSIVDHTDNTKQGKFDASTISANHTQTYTLPNKNGTLALLSDIGTTTTVNGFSGTINITPETGNTTVTNSSGTIKVGLGVNPVITNGVRQTISKSITFSALQNFTNQINMTANNINNINKLTLQNAGSCSTGRGNCDPVLFSSSSAQKITLTGSLVSSGYLGVTAGQNLYLDGNSGAGNFFNYNSALGSLWKSGNVNGILINGTNTSIDLESNLIKNGKFVDNVNSIVASGDNSKVGKFDASTISTGHTQTYTLPNKNGTLALTSDITGGTGTITGSQNVGKGTGSFGVLSTATSTTIKGKNMTAGTGITESGNTTDITITNGGVTSITGTTNNVTASASTGAVTLNLGQNAVTTGGSTQTVSKKIIFSSAENFTNQINMTAQNINNINKLTLQNAGTCSTGRGSCDPIFFSSSSAQKVTLTGSMVTSSYLGVTAGQNLYLDGNSGAGNFLTYVSNTGSQWKSGNAVMYILNGTNKIMTLQSGIKLIGTPSASTAAINLGSSASDLTSPRKADVRIVGSTLVYNDNSNVTQTVGIQPNWNQTNGANRTNIGNSLVMHGLARLITTQGLGKIEISVFGYATPSSLSSGCRVQVEYGTGNPPSAGGTFAGTQVGNKQQVDSSAGVNDWLHWGWGSLQVTGLSTNTKYWVDIAETNLGSSGTCDIYEPTISLKGY